MLKVVNDLFYQMTQVALILLLALPRSSEPGRGHQQVGGSLGAFPQLLRLVAEDQAGVGGPDRHQGQQPLHRRGQMHDHPTKCSTTSILKCVLLIFLKMYWINLQKSIIQTV